jgi:hypothetical protein
MNLISDKDGVDIIISPVKSIDGLQVNIDYNFATKALYNLDHLQKNWNIKLVDGRSTVGSAKFSAYQFISDGVVRRTIAIKFISVEQPHRGQQRSYDVMQYVIDTVKNECNRDWGEAFGDAVVFVEKKDLAALPEKERNNFFSFLKKIGEKVLGFEAKEQPAGGDLAVSVIGESITMQLIEGHLMRSNSVS